MDIIVATEGLLTRVGFTVLRTTAKGQEILIFEDDTVLGFVLAYSSVQSLVVDWAQVSEAAVSSHQLALRRAGQKAWNTYVVMLASGEASHAQLAALSAIEEDLTGTRKIARAAIKDGSDVEAALLPLLPLQSAPNLEAVNMVAEIQQRATELSPRAIEAFISDVEESVVIQVLEEAP